jgi:hypothetical protein
MLKDMGVHEAGEDGPTRHVDDLRTLRYIYSAAPADRRDAVAANHDVGVLDDLIPAHRDHAGSSEHSGAIGEITGSANRYPGLAWPVGGFGGCGAGAGQRCGDGVLSCTVYRRGRDRIRNARKASRIADAVLGCAGTLEVEGEVGIADRPVHRTPVGAPGRELATNLRELACREGCARGVADRNGRGLPSHHRHGDHVEVVDHLRDRLISGRRHHHQ